MGDWVIQFQRDLATLGVAIYHEGDNGTIRNIDPLSEEGLIVIDKMNKIEEAQKQVDELFNFYTTTPTKE